METTHPNHGLDILCRADNSGTGHATKLITSLDMETTDQGEVYDNCLQGSIQLATRCRYKLKRLTGPLVLDLVGRKPHTAGLPAPGWVSRALGTQY